MTDPKPFTTAELERILKYETDPLVVRLAGEVRRLLSENLQWSARARNVELLLALNDDTRLSGK